MPKTLKGKQGANKYSSMTDEELLEITGGYRERWQRSQKRGRGVGAVASGMSQEERSAFQELDNRNLLPREGPRAFPLPGETYQGLGRVEGSTPTPGAPGGVRPQFDLSPRGRPGAGGGGDITVQRPPGPAALGPGGPQPGVGGVDPQKSVTRPVPLDLTPVGRPSYKGRIVGDMQAPIFGTRVRGSQRDPYAHKRHGQGGVFTPPVVQVKKVGDEDDPVGLGLAMNEAKIHNLRWQQRMHPRQKAMAMQSLMGDRQELLQQKKMDRKEEEAKDQDMTKTFQKTFLQIAKQVDPKTGQQIKPEQAAQIARSMMPEWFRNRLKDQNVQDWAKGMEPAIGMDIQEERRRKEADRAFGAQQEREKTRQFEVDRAFDARKGELQKEWDWRYRQEGRQIDQVEQKRQLDAVRNGIEMYWRMAESEGIGHDMARQFIEVWEKEAGVSIFPQGWTHKPPAEGDVGKKDMTPRDQEARAGSVMTAIANYERARDLGQGDSFLSADALMRTVNGEFMDFVPGTTRWKSGDVQNTIAKIKQVVGGMGEGAMKVAVQSVYEDAGKIQKLLPSTRTSSDHEKLVLLRQIVGRFQRELRSGGSSRASAKRIGEWRKLVQKYSDSLPVEIRHLRPEQLYQQQQLAPAPG